MQSSAPYRSAAHRTRPVWPQLHHWYLIAPLIVLAVVVVGYLVTHDAADTARELAVDQYLSLHHLAWLTPVAVTIAMALAPPEAIALTAVISVAVWWRRNPWWGLGFAVIVGGGWLFVGIVKLVIARPRPEPWTLGDPLMPEINNASFPSGHTAFATALVVGLTLLMITSTHDKVRSAWPLVAVPGAVAVVLVAVSRLYLGVHYPSDVACAVPTALAGCCCAIGAWNAVARRIPGAARIFPAARELPRQRPARVREEERAGGPRCCGNERRRDPPSHAR